MCLYMSVCAVCCAVEHLHVRGRTFECIRMHTSAVSERFSNATGARPTPSYLVVVVVVFVVAEAEPVAGPSIALCALTCECLRVSTLAPDLGLLRTRLAATAKAQRQRGAEEGRFLL